MAQEKNHVIAISLPPDAYKALLKVHARQILENEDFVVDGRSGPGTTLTQAVFCLLGLQDAPGNPIIADFLAHQG